MIYCIGERNGKFLGFLNEKDRLALLLSAIGHDLNHPGVTNGFMVNSRHPLAVRYNDASVLENHHAATLIQFLELEGCDFLSALNVEDRTYIRKQIIRTILATDMASHFNVMEGFKNVMQVFDNSSQSHRQSFMGLLLHAADVGNPTLKFDLATLWSLNVIKEFNDQVWKEEKMEIPVSEFLRVGNEISKIKQNQIGFIERIILPLWELMAEHVPNIQDFLEAITVNKNSWEVLESL